VNATLRYLVAPAIILVLLATPVLWTSSYFEFMLILVFIYGVVAVGLNILVGYAGQFSLGHAALMAIGAYVSAGVSIELQALPFAAASGFNVWLGMLLGIGAAAIAGGVLALPAMRLKGPYLAMVTIAFGWITWRILLEWTSMTGGDLGVSSIPRPRIGAYVFDITGYYYLAFAAVAVSLLIQRNIVTSDIGRKYRALKNNEIAAASVGVAVYREKVVVFVISAVFAGIGGVLFAHLQNFISPDNFQFFNSLFFLLAILFGGAGTLLGPIIGAAFLTILPELLQDAERFRLIIYGIIILVTLFVLPRGLAHLLPSFRAMAPRSDTSAVQTGLPFSPPATMAAQAQLPIVALHGIGKSFGGINALSSVHLAVTTGSVHAVIGPNGAGKTTLINIISGFYSPSAGTIALDGHPIALGSLHDAAMKGIARTFQSIKLFGDMTVREHVMVGCEPQSRAGLWDAILCTPTHRREEDRRLRLSGELLEFVGLAKFADAAANTLPYGHRRLLEIARALATQPRLLLLDEPAAGLVASEIADLAKIIRRLRGSGISILLVEHHMDLVMDVSDTVTVMDYGEVISRGSPMHVRQDPRVMEAYFGTSFQGEPTLADSR
jgi:ABC-type branched-subunit amino acid transport system ATPase component/ABC-type branched-subunit amino acid transport system permease subunit